ncbi:hypothetical protein [Massilia sp. LjRoot122]|uniref:hypothetical protein n=1 Tax=Massilia sp. LjRoot122 TaxID=3342257 RepID=UPI003ECE03F0
MSKYLRLSCALAGLLACSAASWAALPKPTPAQQQEAAAKKAAADAKAAKDKEALAASMDALSTRWRSQAPSKGWKVNPPVAIAAAPAAVTPPGPAPGVAGPGTMAPGAVVNTMPPGAAPPGAARAAAAAGMVPPGVTPPNAGMPAAPPANAAPGTAAAAPATGAAPHSRQALNAANVPIKSEKLGTAAPSEDVKVGQTKAVPKGAAPATEKAGTPKTANKQ